MSELQLFIRREDGSVAAVAVPADGTVTMLREAAAAAAGVETARLSFGGAELQDGEAALADVGLSMQATVDVLAAIAARTVLCAGHGHALAILNDGSVAAWGHRGDGRCDVPDFGGRRAISVAAGEAHSLALLQDGSIATWGPAPAVPAELRAKRAVRIAAGGGIYWSLSMAAFDDGTVALWGHEVHRVWKVDAAASPLLLACSSGHGAVLHGRRLELRGSSRRLVEVDDVRCVTATMMDVVLVGQDGAVHKRPPPHFQPASCIRSGDPPVVAASGGSDFGLLLLADGSVSAWGIDAEVDLGGESAVAVAAGARFWCAALRSGGVMAWGDNRQGQTTVPDFGGRRVMLPPL